MSFGKIVALVGIALLLTCTAAQAGGKLAFVTDRTAGDDDIWGARPDGTYQEELTDHSSDERNPSIARSGDHWVYDRQGDLWIMEADGTNQTNMTAVSTGACSGSDLCTNPDAGKRVNGDDDFRIVFERTYTDTAQTGNPTITEIWMATVDISAGTVGSFAQITDIIAEDQPQLNPTWCDDDYVVWDRQSSDYFREICIQEVDSSGPVGSPFCYFGEAEDDTDDAYPACNPDGDKIAWTRGYGAGNRDIYIMDCVDADEDGNNFDDCDDANAENLTYETSDDDFHPTFDTDGTMILWATDRGTGDDYDIWSMSDTGSHKEPVIDNSDEDTSPDIGPYATP